MSGILKLTGLQRVETETVLSYLNINKTAMFPPITSMLRWKRLFETQGCLPMSILTAAAMGC